MSSWNWVDVEYRTQGTNRKVQGDSMEWNLCERYGSKYVLF